MTSHPYFVSLHHQFRLEQNLPAIGPLDDAARQIISEAAGVLMPKYCPPARYAQVAALARSHFPHLAPRYAYRGKARQIALFRRLAIPHPKTVIYPSVEAAEKARQRRRCPLSLPFVLKGDSGGGGSAVFPVESDRGFQEGLDRLPSDEPVLIQEWIENGGRDLRVVLMGRLIKSYFRVGGTSFYNNVSKGARIDFELQPELQRTGRERTMDLAACLGIDLAAFDLMFPSDGGPPLFVEINFLFGRKGLGGLKGYQRMFRTAVHEWMDRARAAARVDTS